MEQYSFNIFNKFAENGIFSSLNNLYFQKTPVIICVGTDGVMGDSVGPLVGSMLKEKNLPAFIYGELFNPITAREIESVKEFVKKTHPDSKVLVIDSAVGEQEEVGAIKICDSGIKPGLGAKKDLPFLGDVSVMAVVEKKGKVENLKNVRLRLVYKMAMLISSAIEKHILYNLKKDEGFKSLTKLSKGFKKVGNLG